MNPRKIIVTSALPYANGALHLGHLVEYLQTDFWVRYQKMMGHQCIYVCADDTHGTPIMIRARKEGITPETLIARSYEARVKEFGAFEMGFDRYGSTNSEENRKLSQGIYVRLNEKGYISRRAVAQLYCEHCGMFLPGRFVKGECPKCHAKDQYGDGCEVCGATYNAGELESPYCAVCGEKPVMRDSEQLFFELEPFRDFLAKWIPEGPQLFPEDVVTDQPERQIMAEIVREKLLRNLDKEIPHGTAVEVTRFTQRDNDIIDCHVTIYCEKDSHKGIIIGKKGAMLKKISTHAREDMEAFMGAKVYLETWVKVKENWRDNPNAIQNFGYVKE